MNTAPSAVPVENNTVKPMVADPAVSNTTPSVTSTSAVPSNVDYSTQRVKPLTANSAALRNDRSTLVSGKGERPARADRN